ncbi:MAG: hypothetical protein D6757_10555, partial [Alphaproteobacteria bacterium]
MGTERSPPAFRLSSRQADRLLACVDALLQCPLDGKLMLSARLVRRRLRAPFRIARGIKREACEIHVRVRANSAEG